MVVDNPYSVQFKVDIPLEIGTHNYAGHKIIEIKITPSDNVNEVYKPLQLPQGAISNISLAVLRGKVNPARYDAKNTRLYQKVYTASRVDYDTPSLKAIGRAEDMTQLFYLHQFKLGKSTMFAKLL